MLKKLLFGLVITGLCSKLQAQSDQVIPPSPEAAKIAEFSITPTNLYSGRQNLSVPLHTINFDGMTLPISASYYSGGIRANEEAGDIGLGWVLNSTASISRAIMYRDDLMNDHNKKGYVQDIKEVPVVNDFEYFLYTPEYQYIQYNLADTEPDIWTIDFFGTSTKFVLTKKTSANGPIYVRKLTEDPSKITYDEATNTFEVINENGFKGIFNVKGLSTGVSGSSSSSDRFESCNSNGVNFYQGILYQGRYRAQTTWYLSKIISPKGNEVLFNYDLDPATGESKYISVSAPSFLERDWNNVYNSSGTSYAVEDPFTCVQTINEHVYLSTIETDDLIITFNKTSRDDIREIDINNGGYEYYLNTEAPFSSLQALPAQRYTGMTITGKGGVLNKSIEFQHTYFNPTITNNRHRFKRLRLDGISVEDQQYDFEYFDGLPDKSTLGIDYWGYYNGRDENQTLIPPYTPSPCIDALVGLRERREYYVQHENRKANFEFGKAGLLHTVHYPTGGSTKYNYESHDYLITDNEEVPVNDGFYPVTAVDGDSETEPFVYSGYHSTGGECPVEISVYLNMQYNDYWKPGCCSDVVSDEHDQQTSVDIINVNTGDVTQLATWSFLRYEADVDLEEGSDGIPNFYSETEVLGLPAGTYKVRVKRIDDVLGNMRYYASAQVTISPVCDQSPVEPGEEIITNQVAGGARIKEITNYDANGQPLVARSYVYKLRNHGQHNGNTESSGVLMTPLRNIFIYHQLGTPDCAYHLTSQSDVTLANAAQGNFIGYTTIEERYNSTDGIEKGRIVYDYSNQPLQLKSWGLSAEQYDNFNGTLLSSQEFDQQGMIRRRTNYNQIRRQPLDRVLALKYTIDNHNGGVILSFSHNYDLLAEFNTPREIVTKEYFNHDAIEQTETREFNADFLLSKKTLVDSDGDLIEEEYKRPSDYDTPSSALQAMKDQNILAPVIEQVNKVNGEVIAGAGTKFYVQNGIVVPEEVFNYNTATGILTPSPNGSVFPDGYESRARNKFDDYGNLVESIGPDGTVTSYIWGYDHDYPVAQIIGVSNDQLSSITGIGPNYHSGTAGLASSKRQLIESAYPSALVSSYTFIRGLGIDTMTDPNGLTSSYTYDNQGRLLEVRDHENNLINSYEYNYANSNE